MKRDVLRASIGEHEHKPLCKETLNHRELIIQASGMDPLVHTQNSFLKAYQALGVDFINRVPLSQCPQPQSLGSSEIVDENYSRSSLGVYDTWYRYHYPYSTVDEFLSKQSEEVLNYDQLRTPVPHPLHIEDIRSREKAVGDIGMYFCQLYTTLFMWGVEYLGWEVFMMATVLEPEAFDRKFLKPAFVETLRLTDILLESESPYLFFHDDLATANSLACSRDWMKQYLFERYTYLFEKVHVKGKQVVFVCDGNCTEVLGDLRDAGVDAVMLESPATKLENIADVFGDRLIIGGVDTSILANGTPDQVSHHVHEIVRNMKDSQFAISSCGGLHGGIPLQNLEAYFDTRADYGFNGFKWRN